MAILNRRGNKIDFDPNKMLAGEFAYCLDTEELFYCYGVGNVRKLATVEDLQEILDTSEIAYNSYLALVNELETSGTVSTILSSISALQAKVGTAALTTTAQTLIGAINEVKAGSGGSGDSSASTVTFTQASTLANIATGETHSTLFGKIKKFFAFIGTTTLTTISQTITGAINELNAGKVNATLIGVVSGIAQLDSNGVVPANQLPSYVDDVLEYATLSGFPATGQKGKIYINIATNLTYRWSGSIYVAVGAAGSGNAASISYDNTTSGLNATEVQEAIDEVNNSLTVKKLWNNASPTVSFAPQSIILNIPIENCEYYEIIYALANSFSNIKFSTGKIPVDSLARLQLVSSDIKYRELSALSGTNMTFLACNKFSTYAGGATVDNAFCIPISVLGY